MAPAAPALLYLKNDLSYQHALEGADIILADSGLMAFLWNILYPKRTIKRISGYQLLQHIFQLNLLDTCHTLWVVAHEKEKQAAQQFFDRSQMRLEQMNFYIAPFYDQPTIEDEQLLAYIERLKPTYVVINIGGGKQEKIGLYLKHHLSYRPTILCTGAALSFFTGEQAAISTWIDRSRLGWLWRCIENPKVFIPRYIQALHFIPMLIAYGPKSPALSTIHSNLKLSIITPVFNAEADIERCLKSVIDQNVSGIEHIIYDGGSTDQTVAIIEAYAQQYPHIIYRSKPDKGQSDAMNQALQRAQAPFVSFLNADDYYEAGALSKVIAYIEKADPYSIIMANCYIRTQGSLNPTINIPQARNLYQLIAGYEFAYNPSAYCYDKKIHDLVGDYRLDDAYTMDFDFLLRAYRVAHIQYVDDIWGNFTFIPGTKTYEDMQKGLSTQRCDALRQQAYAQLQWYEKLTVQLYRFKLYAIRQLKRLFGKPWLW